MLMTTFRAHQMSYTSRARGQVHAPSPTVPPQVWHALASCSYLRACSLPCARGKAKLEEQAERPLCSIVWQPWCELVIARNRLTAFDVACRH